MTKERKLNILGEDIIIRFNMAVEIAYEDITGEAFSLQGIDKQKNSVALCMAAIIVNNPDTAITTDRFIKEISAVDYTNIVTAVVESMTEWMQIPAVLPKDDQPDEQHNDDEGDTPKN